LLACGSKALSSPDGLVGSEPLPSIVIHPHDHRRTVQLSVQEAQGFFLEITAHLDYFEIFKVNMDGSSPSSHGRQDRSIGAFTHDFDVCDHLFRAGIPAWLVTPCRVLQSILIREVVPFRVAEDVLPLGLPPNSSFHIPWTRKNPKPFVSIRAVLRTDVPPAEPSNRELRQQ
jgi:hypothetical protein